MKMSKMKMWFLMAMMAGGMLVFTSCGEDKDKGNGNGGNVAGEPVLKGDITVIRSTLWTVLFTWWTVLL